MMTVTELWGFFDRLDAPLEAIFMNLMLSI